MQPERNLGYPLATGQWMIRHRREFTYETRKSVSTNRASSAFFAKNWPQYELNGLTAREIEGHKVILPIWHSVHRADVLAYSPPLADKVALSTRRLSIKKIAQALANEFEAAREA
jgi:phosphoribosylaminoimidazole carboxylase (NCAIR synthetase)